MPRKARDRARGETDMRHPSTCSAGRPSPANGSDAKCSRETRDQTDGASECLGLITATRGMPKDNDELRRAELRFRRAVRKLEHIAGLMDELQREIEGVGPRLSRSGAQTITGTGVISLVVKAETLAKAVTGFASALRRSDVQGRLPPEGRYR